MTIAMRCCLGLVAVCALAFVAAANGAAAEPPQAVASSTAAQPTPTNEYCPVMSKTKAVASLFLDYEGQRIYFCHEVCKTRFGRAPEKYLANLPAVMQQAIREHQQAAVTATQPSDAAKRPASGPARSEGEGRRREADNHDGNLRRLGQFLGRFHPVVVHLPIGLLFAAALAEGLFMRTRADWLSGAARFSVLMGAAGAVVAASLGWLSAMSTNYDGDLARVLEYHRWVGTATAALAVVAALLCEMHQRRAAPVWRMAYRFTLLLAAALVGLTGHFGGMLVYGVDYFNWR